MGDFCSEALSVMQEFHIGFPRELCCFVWNYFETLLELVRYHKIWVGFEAKVRTEFCHILVWKGCYFQSLRACLGSTFSVGIYINRLRIWTKNLIYLRRWAEVWSNEGRPKWVPIPHHFIRKVTQDVDQQVVVGAQECITLDLGLTPWEGRGGEEWEF